MPMYDEMLFQKKINEEYRQDCREIYKAEVKASVVENVRINANMQRQLQREMEREKIRCEYEILELSEDGTYCLKTQNLSFEPKGRRVTNLKNVRATKYVRASEPMDSILCMEGDVFGREIKILFASENIGKIAYLQRKFAACGIVFYVEERKIRYVLTQLISDVFRQTIPVVYLPDRLGWMKKPDGEYEYVKEGELTWEMAKKLTK